MGLMSYGERAEKYRREQMVFRKWPEDTQTYTGMSLRGGAKPCSYTSGEGQINRIIYTLSLLLLEILRLYI